MTVSLEKSRGDSWSYFMDKEEEISFLLALLISHYAVFRKHVLAKSRAFLFPVMQLRNLASNELESIVPQQLHRASICVHISENILQDLKRNLFTFRARWRKSLVHSLEIIFTVR